MLRLSNTDAPRCQLYVLDNGLRIIRSSSFTEVTYCGFAIDAGTRDELPHEQGMAHFVEHLIFKGTEHHRASYILNRMEHVGGELNAYTNKEETVVYCACLQKDFERALELLADIVFHSTFPAAEIEKEVGVIIDEIQSYEDNPSELIFDDFEDLIFRSHPLGRNILGTPERLKQYGTADAARFTRRFYQPGNMVFFTYNGPARRKWECLVEKYLGDVPAAPVEKLRTPPPLYVPQHLVVPKDTHQTHVMIGARGYDAYDERRTALYLLNNLLGGPGMNSRLNVELREKRGLVYNVESNLTAYTDTGTFCIYFGCDPADEGYCLRVVRRELKRLREQKLTPVQLHRAQQQLIGQIGVAGDNNENNALGMAKSFLHYNKYESSEAVFRRIEALTPELLLDVANELFADDHLSTLIYR